MFTSYMSADCVVTGKRSGTEWAWYTDSLMSLSNVSAEVCFVPV